MPRGFSTSLLVVGLTLGCSDHTSLPTSPSGPTTGVSIEKLEVDPSVLGGQAARGSVTLSGTPTQDFVVALVSTDPVVTVPASLTIPAGSMSAEFGMSTARVAQTTDVTITAQAGQSTRSATIRLRIDPTGLKPSAIYAVGFSGLTGNRAPVSTYTEHGFTVSIVSASWESLTTFGDPAPFIQFNAPSAATVTGELRITAGGATFWLTSLDLYSSTTRIPYVVEGFLSAQRVVSRVHVQPQTFGAFAAPRPPSSTPPWTNCCSDCPTAVATRWASTTSSSNADAHPATRQPTVERSDCGGCGRGGVWRQPGCSDQASDARDPLADTGRGAGALTPEEIPSPSGTSPLSTCFRRGGGLVIKR